MPQPRARMSSFIALAITSLFIGHTSGQETQRQYLSGKDRDSAVPWEFFCTSGRESGKWTTIPVPSCWDVLGFGTLSFYKDQDIQPVEQGLYRHSFSVPADWAGKRVFLVVDGAMTDTEAKINGQSVGPIHQGGFTQFKYEVTDLVRAGAADNRLEVTVTKKSADESVNRAERIADYWLFGGIFRPVYLEAVPREYVQRVAIDARADGAFAIDVFTPAMESSDAIEVELRDSADRVVGTARGTPDKSQAARLTTRVENVATWTAETPTLYTAVIRLRAGNNTVHEVRQRFAFRTVEVRPGDGIYLNSKRLMLKGVNRHVIWPDSGRTVTPQLDRDDIELIKSMNMNAVRTSHYPPDKSFLELCDELGIYVIEDLPGWQKAYDTPIGTKMVEEMIVRDVNHPSILFWTNGNEGGWNTKLDALYQNWDPQKRPVIHPWALHDNIETKHYPNYEALKKLLAGRHVYVPTEFLHALYDGGAGGGLRDYWDAMRASKISAGGFIWAFSDEGVKRPTDGRIDVAGNAGPDGVVGPYREKEGAFYAIKEIWSPVVMPQELPAGFSGEVAIENRYHFSSLNRVKFTWSLRKWRGMAESEAGHTTIVEGTATSPDIAPGASGTVKLELPENWRDADALSLTATDWDGREVLTSVWPLKPTSEFAPRERAQAAADQAASGELRSGNAAASIDATGVLESINVSGKQLPFAGPRVALGSVTPESAKPTTSATTSTTQPTTAASTTPAAPTVTGELLSAKWTAAGDGWFRLAYTYRADGACEFAGVTFDLPEEGWQSVRWLGDGPYRVWKNRTDGVTLGVWENSFNDTATGAIAWKYPEFKGFFSNLHWAKLKTEAGTLTIATETPGIYLRLGTPRGPGKDLARTTAVTFPEGSISLMHMIPAIGTKFDRADKLGPASEPNIAAGTYEGTAWIRFEP